MIQDHVYSNVYIYPAVYITVNQQRVYIKNIFPLEDLGGFFI